MYMMYTEFIELQLPGHQLDQIPSFLFSVVFPHCTLHKVSYISRETLQMKVRDLRENRQEFKVLGRSEWFLKVRQHGRSPSTPPTARGVSRDLAETPPHPDSPPLGCGSPSTSSHPSLLRFHFNRWSSSSFHTAYGKMWLEAARRPTAKSMAEHCFQCFRTYKGCCRFIVSV